MTDVFILRVSHSVIHYAALVVTLLKILPMYEKAHTKACIHERVSVQSLTSHSTHNRSFIMTGHFGDGMV